MPAGEARGIASNPKVAYGYWLSSDTGQVDGCGSAIFYGSMAGKSLAASVVGIAATSDGQGYWLVARDGGVFAFGDAVFRGSATGTSASPIVGMANSRGVGGGYWLVNSDGGVFSYHTYFEGSAQS